MQFGSVILIQSKVDIIEMFIITQISYTYLSLEYCFKKINIFSFLTAYDPNPLLLIGKRRRHTTADSVEQPRKSQSSTPSTDTAPKVKRGPGRPPKVKKEERPRENDSDDDEEEEEVDVCGFDEDHDDVFTSGFSMENFRKERAKSHASSSGDKHTSKKRKEKSWDVTDSEQENKSSAKKRKERRDSSDDSDCRTSDQGKTYHSANITDRIPFVSSVRAANNQKCNGSCDILSRIESESSDDDTNMESENGWQSSRSEFCSFDEDISKDLEKRSKRSLSTDSKSKIAGTIGIILLCSGKLSEYCTAASFD